MVVIGVGEAGTNMAVALYNLVRQEGKDKYFEFILIDSNRNDLDRKEIPEEIKERIPLESPRRGVAERDREHFKYLHEKVVFSSSGVIRQRVLARYLIDKNYTEIYKKIRNIVRDFADKHSADLSEEGSSLTIWLLHSLGGGTGSGSFPILAAMLKGIKADVEKELGEGLISICGVGSLPTMPEDPAAPIEGDPVYYANSLAALRELERMLEGKVEIPIYSSNVTLSLDEFPFAKYFMIGVNESELKKGIKEEWVEAYIDEKNFSVASCILALYEHLTGPEHWPRARAGKEFAIGSLSEHEISVPMWLLKNYVDKKKSLEEREDELKRVIEEKKRVMDDLNRLQNVNVDVENTPDDTKKNVEAMVEEKLQEDIIKISEDELEEFVERIKGTSGIEGKVYCVKVLRDKFDEMRYEKEWSSEVTRLWEKYPIRNEEKYKDKTEISDKDAALNEWMERKIREIRRWLANPPPIHLPGQIERKNKQLEELREEKRKLEDARERKEHWNKLKGKIGELYEYASKELREEIDRKARAKESMERKEREVYAEIERMRRDIESIEQDLKKTRFGRIGYLQLKNVERITEEELKSLKSLKDFVERGYVEEKDISRGMSTQIGRAKGWASISMEKPKYEALFILRSEENGELVGNLLPASKKLEDTREYDLQDKYTIKMCVYSLGMEIKDLSDFYLLDKAYKEGRLQRELHGISVEESYAYPEWFPEDESLRGIFSKVFE